MKRNRQHDPTEACREYALTLLDRRPYPRAQLMRKLRGRGFSTETVDETVAGLERLGLVDDLAFARAYAAEKARGTQPVGPHRIVAALMKKGVATEVIEQALRELAEEGETPTELDRALDAARRKWVRIQRAGGPERAGRARLARFLFGRGFSAETVWAAVERATAEGTDDDSDLRPEL
ncbi:MAG: regulatory protein RecX [Kiritimatiellaeota bacterium]|nr:regulatory protein RecX [Kiritimatiellota bacterium]